MNAMELLTCDFHEYLTILGKSYIEDFHLTKDNENEKSWLITFSDGTTAKVKVMIK